MFWWLWWGANWCWGIWKTQAYTFPHFMVITACQCCCFSVRTKKYSDMAMPEFLILMIPWLFSVFCWTRPDRWPPVVLLLIDWVYKIAGSSPVCVGKWPFLQLFGLYPVELLLRRKSRQNDNMGLNCLAMCYHGACSDHHVENQLSVEHLHKQRWRTLVRGLIEYWIPELKKYLALYHR